MMQMKVINSLDKAAFKKLYIPSQPNSFSIILRILSTTISIDNFKMPCLMLLR